MFRVMWNKHFANAFFRDTVTVLKVTKGSGYSRTETTETLCTVTGDLQPYSGGLAQEQYGFNIECQQRFFYDECDEIQTGNYIEVNGLRYRIEYVKKDRMGCVAFLKEVRT